MPMSVKAKDALENVIDDLPSESGVDSINSLGKEFGWESGGRISSRLRLGRLLLLTVGILTGCDSKPEEIPGGIHYSTRPEISHVEPICKGPVKNPDSCIFKQSDQLGFEIGWSAKDISEQLRKMKERENEFFVSFNKIDGQTRLGVNPSDYETAIEWSEQFGLLAYYSGKDGVQIYTLEKGIIRKIKWEKHSGHWP